MCARTDHCQMLFDITCTRDGIDNIRWVAEDTEYAMYLKYFSVPPRKFTLGMYVVPKIYSFVSSTPVKLFSCL